MPANASSQPSPAHRPRSGQVPRAAAPAFKPSEWLDALPFGVFFQNAAGEIGYVNHFITSLLGCRRTDLVGRRTDDERWWPFDVVDEDGHRLGYAGLDALLPSSQPAAVATIGIRIHNGGDQTHWFELRSSQVRGGVLYTFVEVEAARRQTTSLWARANRMRMLLNHVADAYVVVDRQLNVVEWFGLVTDGFASIDGSELTLTDLVPEDSVDSAEQAIADLFAGHASSSFEMFWEAEDGMHFSEVNCRRLPDGLVGCVFHDITDRWRAEEELLSLEERYRMLADNCADVIARIGFVPRFHIEYVSPSVQQLLGYEPADFYREPGLVLRALYRPMSLSRGFRDLTDYEEVAEVCVRHRDGHEVWIELHSTPIMSAKGSIVGIDSVARDVTERRRQTLALQEREQRFRELADHAADVVLRIDLHPEPRMTYVSPSAERLLGYPVGMFYDDPTFIFSVVRPDFRSSLARLFSGDHDFARPLALIALTASGDERCLEGRVAAITEAGRLLALTGIIRDTTGDTTQASAEDWGLGPREG